MNFLVVGFLRCFFWYCLPWKKPAVSMKIVQSPFEDYLTICYNCHLLISFRLFFDFSEPWTVNEISIWGRSRWAMTKGPPWWFGFVRGGISELRSWLFALSHSKDPLINQTVCHENVTGGFSIKHCFLKKLSIWENVTWRSLGQLHLSQLPCSRGIAVTDWRISQHLCQQFFSCRRGYCHTKPNGI